MERLETILTEKYYWMPEFQLIMRWADVAANEGMNTVDICGFIASKIFAKQAVQTA